MNTILSDAEAGAGAHVVYIHSSARVVKQVCISPSATLLGLSLLMVDFWDHTHVFTD